METVEVIIRLPKEVYEGIQQIDRIILGRRSGKTIEFALWNGVRNGKPLPKGHGRLKDTDAICKDIISALGIRNENYLLEVEKAIYKRIKNATTIIEADKET